MQRPARSLFESQLCECVHVKVLWVEKEAKKRSLLACEEEHVGMNRL